MTERLSSEPSTVDRILEVATTQMRERGYHDVSYRDIAAQVGIKAASLHYHFPSKGALGAAVAGRYRERSLAALGDPGDLQVEPEALLERFVRLFREGLAQRGLVCLCGLLAAESGGLPAEVTASVREFIAAEVGWLREVLRRLGVEEAAAAERAWALFSAAQGSLSLAAAMGDPAVYDRAMGAAVRMARGGVTAA